MKLGKIIKKLAMTFGIPETTCLSPRSVDLVSERRTEGDDMTTTKIATATGIKGIRKYLAGPVNDASLGVHVTTVDTYVGYFTCSPAEYMTKHGAKLLDFCGHTICVEV
jgi:hypothetical protein